jgi:hypothetical protein
MSEIVPDGLCPICNHLSSAIGDYILRLGDLEASAAKRLNTCYCVVLWRGLSLYEQYRHGHRHVDNAIELLNLWKAIM